MFFLGALFYRKICQKVTFDIGGPLEHARYDFSFYVFSV